MTVPTSTNQSQKKRSKVSYAISRRTTNGGGPNSTLKLLKLLTVFLESTTLHYNVITNFVFDLNIRESCIILLGLKMKINEYAKAVGLTPRAIRLYEEKGLITSQRNQNNKYRFYNQNQILIGKKISELRKLGFTVIDVLSLLKQSPDLNLKDIKKNMNMHLTKLNYQIDELKSKVSETEKVIKSIEGQKSLSKNQKNIFTGFTHAILNKSAFDYCQFYLKKEILSSDEELQMIACAYTHLFLNAAAQANMKEFAKAHKLISTCLARIKEENLAKRHLSLSNAYSKM